MYVESWDLLECLKIQIFGFPCCSNREDLSIDVSITIIGRSDIDEAKMISAQVKIQFRPFLKKSSFWVSML